MFQKIKIQNLRGIALFEHDKFSRINVLVGPNNSGKTTVLEALFLLVGISNPQLALNINAFRKLKHTENNDFTFNFRNLDFNNKTTLSCFIKNDGQRFLEITPLYSKISNMKFSDESFSQTDMNTGVSNHFDAIGLKYDFKKQKKKYHSELSLKTSQFDTQYDKNLLSVQYDKNYKETLQARFLSNDTLISFVHDRIDKIIRSKKKDELISELKKIDSKIIDISLSSNKIVYVDIGIDQMIPLNLMGDGFSKVCAIIANLLVLKDGYLIIDEIENGLHYESLSILWNAIISACKKFNVQIFLSTHSYEAITALLSVISTNNYNKEDFQFLLVQKFDDKQHKCYSYDVDNMLANIESEVEFRGKTLGK